jgi:hypothetical protein
VLERLRDSRKPETRGVGESGDACGSESRASAGLGRGAAARESWWRLGGVELVSGTRV